MRVRVFYHDRCFDGASSASLFSRFYKERIRENVEFQFTGLVHRAGALFNENEFDGDENAIVDFKYSASPKITWWFDHHQSAFLTPADAEHFETQTSSKMFYDPDFKSCTKFIATVAETRFGFDVSKVAELVEWADTIDGALYQDAQTAVEMKQPAMKLTMVIESAQDEGYVPKIIPHLAYEPLAQVIELPFVAERIPRLMERHWKSIEIVRSRAQSEDGTVFFDVTDQDLEGYNKFIPYYVHPECTYSVGLSKSSFRTKVSVGSNPWTTTPEDKMVNLAKICERYGGGGHARVWGYLLSSRRHTAGAHGGAGDCGGTEGRAERAVFLAFHWLYCDASWCEVPLFGAKTAFPDAVSHPFSTLFCAFSTRLRR